MPRILGVDLGTRRIGLALSDPTGTLASPLAVLARSGDRAQDHQRDRGRGARARGGPDRRRPPAVALGRSRGRPSAARVEEIDELRAAAPEGITVDCYDERFTTVIAQRSLVESGMRRDARKQVVDKVAAAVMLQSYLEAQP